MEDRDASQSRPSESPLQTGVIDALARLPEQTLLNEHALAGTFGVTPRTVLCMVKRREIPPGVPFAGRTAWMAGKVLAFIEERLRHAEMSATRRHEAFLKNRP